MQMSSSELHANVY
uniref:Uncharacterized protein n=1 Tax=Anguilla anguilla TaxID=7936 RepID=A0A0E9Q0S4_ANGAN